MKRYCLFLTMLLLVVQGRAVVNRGELCKTQDINSVGGSKTSDFYLDVFDLRYGLWKTDFCKTNQSLSAIGYKQIKDQMNLIGLSFNTRMAVGCRIAFDIHLDYDQFLPQQYIPMDGDEWWWAVYDMEKDEVAIDSSTERETATKSGEESRLEAEKAARTYILSRA